jgi:hypothetical protein
MKIDMCKSIGYKLIHIWEQDWNTNKQQIKNDLIKLF